MEQQTKNRIEWIDSLKGLAAVFVIFAHFWEVGKQLYGYIGNENSLFSFFNFITIKYIDIGKVAVVIFFIISGYLTANVFRKKTKSEFLIDRIKRMYPLYWLSILLSLILITKEPIIKIIINATMFQQFLGVDNIIGAFWTLQIDWIFYFICIFLVILKIFENKKAIKTCYYGLLGISLLSGIMRFYIGGVPIAIGILLSATFIGLMIKRNESDKETKKYNTKLNIILFFIILLPTVMFGYTEQFTNIQVGFRYYSTYILAFIIFFIGKKIIKHKNIFSRLGKYSYSLYLLHPTIGFFIINKLYHFNINILENLIIAFIITIISSMVSGKYIENIWKKEKNKNKVCYINGRFLTQKITGVQRYAIEVVKQLDKLKTGDKYILLIPQKGIIQNLELKNIEIKSIGKFTGHIWEQISLPVYVIKHGKGKLLNLCNLAPIIYPGYVTIHDIAFKTHPEHLDWKFSLIYRIITKLNIKHYQHIFTVSNFSKKEIITNYKIKEDKITVTYNSAEHMKNIKPDNNILKNLNLENKEFYFSLGSKSPHKNHEFIIQCAKNNPNILFVVSGNDNKKIFKDEENENIIENIIYTGYLKDEELVALYQNCKAFIFPSLYEGFGIPPLEAMTMGCKHIILSNIEVFKEIYQDYVTYINFNNNDCYDIKNKIFSEKETKELLNKYSWNKVAQNIAHIIRRRK